MVFLNFSYSKVLGNQYSCDFAHTQSNSLESTNHPQKVVGNVINWNYILGGSLQLALLLMVMLLMQGSFYVANMTISLNAPDTRPHEFWLISIQTWFSSIDLSSHPSIGC